MTIRVASPPRESLDELKRVLPDVATMGDEGPRFLMEAAPEEYEPTLPHKVFTIGLEDLARGKGLENPELIGWRYLMARDDSVRAAAEVACDPSGVRHEFAEVNEGPFNEATQRALSMAEGLDVAQAGSYEFNLLRIPGLYVVALWLKDEVGRNDLFIPIGPTLTDLDSGKTYSREEFEKILRKAAEARLRFDDSPRG